MRAGEQGSQDDTLEMTDICTTLVVLIHVFNTNVKIYQTTQVNTSNTLNKVTKKKWNKNLLH